MVTIGMKGGRRKDINSENEGQISDEKELETESDIRYRDK